MLGLSTKRLRLRRCSPPLQREFTAEISARDLIVGMRQG